jgi:hypothetical protein
VFVDLTGFEDFGEHANAAACMDVVLMVALSHRTKEREIVRLAAELPPQRFAGILLVG